MKKILVLGLMLVASSSMAKTLGTLNEVQFNHAYCTGYTQAYVDHNPAPEAQNEGRAANAYFYNKTDDDNLQDDNGQGKDSTSLDKAYKQGYIDYMTGPHKTILIPKPCTDYFKFIQGKQ